MSEFVARIGRQKQRYENGFRLVSGCIPYKFKQGEDGDLKDILLVLMISTPNRSDLIFPKGGWENDETDIDAARREALEEAGIQGIIHETRLGEWIFKSKSKENSSKEGACKGCMFAMEVKEELDFWPEKSTHGRLWVSVADAFERSRYPWMREALDACIKFLSKQFQIPCNVHASMNVEGERSIDVSEPSKLPWIDRLMYNDCVSSERVIDITC